MIKAQIIQVSLILYQFLVDAVVNGMTPLLFMHNIACQELIHLILVFGIGGIKVQFNHNSVRNGINAVSHGELSYKNSYLTRPANPYNCTQKQRNETIICNSCLKTCQSRTCTPDQSTQQQKCAGPFVWWTKGPFVFYWLLLAYICWYINWFSVLFFIW